jgi:SAM-dependent methyltransferase
MALPPGRAQYFRQFVDEYQTVRAAEGRGSLDGNFYLLLPFADVSGRNCWQWEIRARSYQYFVSRILPALGTRSLRVLDLGAGNGWLSHRLALLGHRPVAVDLLVNPLDGLGAASHYLFDLPGLFPRFQAEMDHLPFEDHQFECAVFNASFHYSEDYGITLAEALRCVRPGGFIAILDSPWYRNPSAGVQMVSERRRAFQLQFGFPSDALRSRDFLTDADLQALEGQFSIEWDIHCPWYGPRMAARPWLAALRGKRQPATFRIYIAKAAVR